MWFTTPHVLGKGGTDGLGAVVSVVLSLLKHSWFVMGGCQPITCSVSVGCDPQVPEKEEKYTGMRCCGVVKGCAVSVWMGRDQAKAALSLSLHAQVHAGYILTLLFHYL